MEGGGLDEGLSIAVLALLCLAVMSGGILIPLYLKHRKLKLWENKKVKIIATNPTKQIGFNLVVKNRDLKYINIQKLKADGYHVTEIKLD